MHPKAEDKKKPMNTTRAQTTTTTEQQIKLDRKNCWLIARICGKLRWNEKNETTIIFTDRQISMACLWYTRITVNFRQIANNNTEKEKEKWWHDT